MQECAQELLDSANIVSEAIFNNYIAPGCRRVGNRAVDSGLVVKMTVLRQ